MDTRYVYLVPLAKIGNTRKFLAKQGRAGTLNLIGGLTSDHPRDFAEALAKKYGLPQVKPLQRRTDPANDTYVYFYVTAAPESPKIGALYSEELHGSVVSADLESHNAYVSEAVKYAYLVFDTVYVVRDPVVKKPAPKDPLHGMIKEAKQKLKERDARRGIAPIRFGRMAKVNQRGN